MSGDALRIPESNLKIIEDSCPWSTQGAQTLYDAEHFSTAIKPTRNMPRHTLKAAQGLPDCLILCDTNGGTLPVR
jgi:2-isopropylmalate synthase